MLIGQYEGKIGEKHQMALPKKFRDVLGDKLIVTKGLENHLILVSEQHWKTLLEGTQGKPFTDKTSHGMQRFLLGNATLVELDSKGRCVLPDYLRSYAQISSEIVFVGLERFVEVWDKSAWDEEQKNLTANIAWMAEKLSNPSAQEGAHEK